MRFAQLSCLCLVAAQAAEIRPVPPPGIVVPEKDIAELREGLARLGNSLEGLRDSPFFADVAIFREAVRYAVDYSEFFKLEEVARARELLRLGQTRAEQLRQAQAPWRTATGLVVRGYRSRIDGSIQPYGLVVPESYQPLAPGLWRLDAWFHGRNETLSELNFLVDRQRNPGEFTPRDTFVLHLYGRYCNANKFAGEIDLFEALEAVQREYPIDPNRLVVRGFSMGGAATWHIAAHHAGRWAAAAPGAGFAETPAYLKMRNPEAVPPNWWEEKLWSLYNATDYAANFVNLPLVAYSGEIDPQKQAADIMASALEKEGIELVHIIGPQTPHRYHPASKIEIDRRIDAIAARGRDPYPARVVLVTHTLRYNRMKWVQADALGEHWEPARIEAAVEGSTVRLKTSNVTALTLDFGPGGSPFPGGQKVTVNINGTTLPVPGALSDRSWRVRLRQTSAWNVVPALENERPAKRHGLQGPIDDAFMDSFLFVAPTGTALLPGVATWADSEMARGIREWRRQFRGEVRVSKDTDVTADEIRSANLILWGDPGSNQLLARLLPNLPFKWDARQLRLNGRDYPAESHVPVLIFPNPLNPDRYVVLNSSFTMREYDYLTNARQVPKLPDWAVVDLSVPPNERWPGKIADAGFFDERWGWKTRKAN